MTVINYFVVDITQVHLYLYIIFRVCSFVLVVCEYSYVILFFFREVFFFFLLIY